MTPVQTPSHLTLDAVSCRRAGRRVFADLSATVAGGRGLLLAGPNGSGKSSLLRVIAGLTPNEAGQVTLNGGDPRPDLIYIGHATALKPLETLSEMLRLWALTTGGERPTETRIRAAADRFELCGLLETPFRYFSSGQRRRAALARLLVLDRPLWLLDEPTVGLDQASRTRLTGVMRDHLSGGGLIVAASHDPLGDLPMETLNMAEAGSASTAVPGADDRRVVDTIDEVWL